MIGLDPAAMTLRELMLMADERKRVMGELAAWHFAGVFSMLGGSLSPSEINPYRIVTAKELAAKAKANKRRFFAGLSVALFGKNVYDGQPSTEA